MRALLKKRDFYAVRFEGTRYDAGDKLGFLIATVEFALKHSELASEFREYLNSLKAGKVELQHLCGGWRGA